MALCTTYAAFNAGMQGVLRYSNFIYVHRLHIKNIYLSGIM